MKLLRRIIILIIGLSFITFPSLILISFKGLLISSNEEFISAADNSFPTPTEEDDKSLEFIFSRPIEESSMLKSPAYSPISLGFNRYQAEDFFKSEVFTICSGAQRNILSSELKLLCDPLENPLAYRSNYNNTELFGNAKSNFTLVPIPYNYTFSNSTEYLYIQCSESKKAFYLSNIFDESVALKAKKQEKALKSLRKPKKNSRPLTVVIFLVDSLSRLGLFRNMPKLINFFNSELVYNQTNLSEKFVIYDFYGTNSISHRTLFNIIPMLYGKTFKEIEDIIGTKKLDNEDDAADYKKLQESFSLWKYYEKYGFVTMILFETVSDAIPYVFGREFLADHAPNSFWQLARDFAGYDDFSDDYACLGNKYVHELSLDYLKSYLKNYEGYNRMAYVHLSISHEETGSRAKLGDNNFTDFFKDTLEYFMGKNEDVVIMFASDHGKARDEHVGFEARGERLAPFHFLISNKEFIYKQKAHKNLDLNSQRLVSRYDWYNTLKYLAESPYNDLDFINDGRTETSVKSINLFKTVASSDRNCYDIGVSQERCLNTNFKDIQTGQWEKSNPLSFIISSSVSKINNVLSTNKLPTKTLGKVLKIQSHNLQNSGDIQTIHYLCTFSLNNTESALFLAHGSSASKGGYQNIKEHKYSETKSYSEKKNKKILKYIFKLWTITRLDVVNKNDIFNNIKFPALSYNYIWSVHGKSCQVLCKDIGLGCVNPMFFDNFLKYLAGKGYEIRVEGNNYSIEIANNTVVVGRKDMCQESYDYDVGICHCCMLS